MARKGRVLEGKKLDKIANAKEGKETQYMNGDIEEATG